jgi:NAD(P)-dependent dehydrogenase (short-subunit alcohol dehydrogenase family)
LVTGGNAGIGFALCRQLAVEHGCRVFMGARSIERGEDAAKSIRLPEGCDGSVEFVHLDVSLDVSVTAAAGAVATRLLPGDQLYAIVNNAGT